jgi:hypothetical protein
MALGANLNMDVLLVEPVSITSPQAHRMVVCSYLGWILPSCYVHLFHREYSNALGYYHAVLQNASLFCFLDPQDRNDPYRKETRFPPSRRRRTQASAVACALRGFVLN